MVVAEACSELVVVHFVHCTLSMLLSFWWSSFLWTCFWWRGFMSSFLQTD